MRDEVEGAERLEASRKRRRGGREERIPDTLVMEQTAASGSGGAAGSSESSPELREPAGHRKMRSACTSSGRHDEIGRTWQKSFCPGRFAGSCSLSDMVPGAFDLRTGASRHRERDNVGQSLKTRGQQR